MSSTLQFYLSLLGLNVNAPIFKPQFNLQTSSNKTSSNKTSSNKTSNKTSSNKTSSNKTSNDTSSNKTSSNDTSSNKTSSNKTSSNKTSCNDTSCYFPCSLSSLGLNINAPIFRPQFNLQAFNNEMKTDIIFNNLEQDFIKNNEWLFSV